jgi:hypothetical protein
VDRPDAVPDFESFVMAGFECSSHRRSDGQRLDLLRATGHDPWAFSDYRQIAGLGLKVARDGVRWHLIESRRGRYDWSSFLPILDAARAARVEVIWDLCHYGWPDDLDIWSAEFVERFSSFAAAVARLIRDRSDTRLLFCPVNEISYFAWAGGEIGRMQPAGQGRGAELKRQLVRASIAATEAIKAVDPAARFITAEPLIHVDAGLGPEDVQRDAKLYRQSQFESIDMLTGRAAPELGGHPALVDVVGLNYYPDNQWYLNGSTIPLGHHAYRPLSDMLGEVYERYGLPLMIAETGAEGHARPYWLHYVADQAKAAILAGTPVLGLCLYPILDYPGWDNERTCHVGVLSAPDGHGRRSIFEPLRREIEKAEEALAAASRSRRMGPPAVPHGRLEHV